MRELSEKEIEEMYKDIKLTEIPDMWDDIERNLAPKKKRKTWKRWIGPVASMAAVVLVLIVLIPVMGNLGLNGSKSDTAMENSEEVQYSSTESAEDFMEEAAPKEEKEELVQDLESGAMSDSQNEQCIYEENEMAATESLDRDKLDQWTVEIYVLEVKETEDGLEILAEVTEDGPKGYEMGQEVTIFYQGDLYNQRSFQLFTTVILEIKEEKLNLLEILP